MLAKCNFYVFLSSVLYVNIVGAQDFWFTADEQCVPGFYCACFALLVQQYKFRRC